jgi:hypothetical protein
VRVWGTSCRFGVVQATLCHVLLVTIDFDDSQGRFLEDDQDLNFNMNEII